MSDISKDLHSLIITDQNTDVEKNTWDDWHLVPSSRPSFAMPKLKSYTQDIPGANGKIDLSSALTGYESYENRSGSIEFIVMNQGLDTSVGSNGYNVNNQAWAGIKAEISNFLHGKQVKVVDEDQSEWYFLGRVSVNEWKSSEKYSTITLDYDLEPFKYSISSTLDMWKWDPFNFRTGIIRTYDQSAMKFDSSGSSFDIQGTATPVVPTIFVSSACTLRTAKGTYNLKAGSNKNPLILVYPGNQTWRFSGNNGSAAIYFRERSF